MARTTSAKGRNNLKLNERATHDAKDSEMVVCRVEGKAFGRCSSWCSRVQPWKGWKVYWAWTSFVGELWWIFGLKFCVDVLNAKLFELCTELFISKLIFYRNLNSHPQNPSPQICNAPVTFTPSTFPSLQITFHWTHRVRLMYKNTIYVVEL
jgi:hypothetical protein